MKLRIQGDAIRLRLNRKEVDQFAREGRVSAAVHFGGTELRYTIAAAESSTEVCAAFSGAEVMVTVPAQAAKEWADSDQVGLHADQPVAGGTSLAIDVEKDFQCMHKGDDARDPDAFPNPLLTVT
jgi:hypothetical protein